MSCAGSAAGARRRIPLSFWATSGGALVVTLGDAAPEALGDLWVGEHGRAVGYDLTRPFEGRDSTWRPPPLARPHHARVPPRSLAVREHGWPLLSRFPLALSELAASFARAYPALAPRLAEASSDPDVERLLEAFTYLTERVHRLIDAGSPAAAQYFADLLAPELSRPFPSATILAVTATRPAFSRPRGCRVRHSLACRRHAVPLSCVVSVRSSLPACGDARIVWSAAEGQAWELSAAIVGRPSEGRVASLFPLRLHLGGDARIASTLLLFFRTHLVDVRASLVGSPATAVTIAKRVRPWGLAADEPLLRQSHSSIPGCAPLARVLPPVGEVLLRRARHRGAARATPSQFRRRDRH